MDPFNQHEDYEIWEALRQCGMTGRTPAGSRAGSRPVSRVASMRDFQLSTASNDPEVSPKIMAARRASRELPRTIHPADVLPHIAVERRFSKEFAKGSKTTASKASSDPTKRKVDFPTTPGFGMEVESAEGDNEDGEADEVPERVMIRSLDEKVAVGGKNFSGSACSPSIFVFQDRSTELISQAKAKDNCLRSLEGCSSSARLRF